MEFKAFYENEMGEILAHLGSFRGDIPRHRLESRHSYSFSDLSFDRQLAIWDQLWRQNPGFYHRLHAFFFLERNMKKEAHLREMWPVVVNWQDHIDEWGLCDALAKIYTRMLEIMPGKVYPRLQQWNTDTNLWKRRQSAVSLLYYSRTKKTYLAFDQIQLLIDRLLTDKEYYVQKGVGWALREMHNVYPAETLAYLKENIKNISSIAFTTSIEKVQPDDIRALKALRKKMRY
jgi:3-methyladenine DNA glycosylase AlkD